MSEVLKKDVVTLTFGPDAGDFYLPHQILHTVKLTPDSLAISGTMETSLCEINFLNLTKHSLKKKKKYMAAKPRDSCAPRVTCPLMNQQNTKPTKAMRGAGCPGQGARPTGSRAAITVA